MRNCRGFTLIEIAISVFILLMIMMLSVPSLSGVMADRRLHKSFDAMNDLVRQAQERSITEHRAYLIAWEKEAVVLRPEEFLKDEEKEPVATLPLDDNHVFTLNLPSSLQEETPAEWIFWPSGTCEPATVSFKGEGGSWSADYAALTARPQISQYAAK